MLGCGRFVWSVRREAAAVHARVARLASVDVGVRVDRGAVVQALLPEVLAMRVPVCWWKGHAWGPVHDVVVAGRRLTSARSLRVCERCGMARWS